VQDAWARKQSLTVHGWIYGLTDGRLRDLSMCVTQPEQLSANYNKACDTLAMAPHDWGDS
jgi:carbonic anhydrase